ncbi:fumarylacetoacetase [Actinomycetospora endophytica]|uniref:fumarylacetoacetase n=1 Tax=Actinomycetospora endophytica TaxID=2291215 RepID=A0ABS8P156_9PSEU|nr:fumarylacetoacetase [Actinomycetospora endophytica]MCD2191973.1 fumarylacetoacetase [Actinomycetospora endophytica]
MTGPDDGYGVASLPFGVFDAGGGRHLGVALGDEVVDVGALAVARRSGLVDVLDASSLNPLLAAPPEVWREVRADLREWLGEPRWRSTPAARAVVHPRHAVRMHLPFTVGDYVDFYASEHHATNVGRILRPGTAPLTPNWKHVPIGYHGRGGSVVVSGTPVRRPRGQRKPDDEPPVFGPSERLDFEAEVGFVVGSRTETGQPIPVAEAAEHIFGVVLVNDWSARDIQAWEYVPLGPFLGKSFATSISAWVVPWDALADAHVAPPPRDTSPLPYLVDPHDTGLDLDLEVALNGHVISRPRYRTTYWTPAQQLAHLTSNGAPTRPGDLFASGTVSGPVREEFGCLLELAWGGQDPLTLADGTRRSFLLDGDELTITARAPGPAGSTVALGPVTGTVLPSDPSRPARATSPTTGGR